MAAPNLSRLSIIFAATIAVILGGPVLGQERVDAGTDRPETIISQRIELPNGELILKQTVLVDASLEDTWRYFTESEYISRWMAPVAAAEIAPGGRIQTHYDACASIGEAGTISLDIVNFVPQRLITLQSNLETSRDASWMSDAIYERRNDLYNIIEFAPASEDQTRITSWGLGYRQEPEWDAMLGFFVAGNEWTYSNLQRAVRGGSIWPECAEER